MESSKTKYHLCSPLMKTYDYGKINIFIINLAIITAGTYLPAVLIVIENYNPFQFYYYCRFINIIPWDEDHCRNPIRTS